MMVAMGRLVPMTLFSGVTISGDGATPKLHWRTAVVATSIDIGGLPSGGAGAGGEGAFLPRRP